MQINREWWDGETRNYTNSGSTQVLTAINTSMYDKIVANPNKYIGVEWDKSICPWKINTNSDFFNINWLLPYNINSTSSTVSKSRCLKERKKGYTFYLSCRGNSKSGQRPGNVSDKTPINTAWLGTLSRADTDLSDSVQNGWIQKKYSVIKPVIDFDYSKIFTTACIHTSNGNAFEFGEGRRTNFNPTEWYGLSVQFWCKNDNGTSQIKYLLEIFSLNNEIIAPEWDTTNCWNEEKMFDNGLAITLGQASDGGYEIGTFQSVGTRTQVSSTASSQTGTGSYETYCQNDNVAGALNFYANKQNTLGCPSSEDDIWETEFTTYSVSGENPRLGARRHFKSTVTYDDLLDYIKKQLAYLGFRFCPDTSHINERIDSEYFYIPEIDSKGVTTGNYSAANAPEAENYTNYTWTTDVYSVTPYDGTDDDEGGDPNEYDENNETELNSLAAQAKNYFFNTYCLSPTQLRQLSEYMYTEMPTNQSTADFLTNNPIDVIINLQMFPFTIAAGVTPDILMLGKLKPRYWDATASEWKDILVYNVPTQVIILDCGSCTYYPEYGVHDFRNYEPYCTAELELPYCGNIKIPTSVYLNHTIKVKYIVDLITGACLALVFRDDLAYLAVTGQIGTQFPVSAMQSADLQASIMRKQTQYGESLISVARSTIGGALSVQGAANAAPAPGASTALGAYTGLLSAFNQLEQAEFNVEHIQVPFTMHGSSSPMTSFANEQYPRLILKRPVMLPDYNAENYGHIVGFACNITAPLSAFSGLTVCSTANLDGVAATEAEKQLLRRALLDGIIL